MNCLAQKAEAKAEKEPDNREGKNARSRATTYRKQIDELGIKAGSSDPRQSPCGLPTHRIQATPQGEPKNKTQRNFYDPHSRLMISGSSYLQGYNCQLAVDEKYQVIVAQGVTNHPLDRYQLKPLLEQLNQNCGQKPKTVSADAGYWAPENEAACEALGVDPYISVRRKPEEPIDDLPTSRKAMAAKVQSPKGRAVYARRKAIVEPVNGQIKSAQGFRAFRLRGLEEVSGEWSLVTLAHNLLKLFRYGAVAAHA